MALIYDPRTGRMVDDGRGVPGPATRQAANPNAVNVGRAAAETVLGGLAMAPAALIDGARVGATRLLGGDPSTLPGGPDRFTTAAGDTLASGTSALQQANTQFVGDVREAGLGALGAQPVTPAPVVAPQRPPVATTPMTAPAPALAPAPAPVANVPPVDVQGINAQLAESLSSMRPPQSFPEPAQRGNYNAQNTDLTQLRARAAPTDGINFGFGVNGAESAGAYLARMQQVDQQRAMASQQRGLMNEARWARQTLDGNPSAGEAFAARQQLAALNPQIGALTEAQGGLAQTGLRNQGALQVAGMQSQADLARTTLAGEYGLMQADVTGQYGLGAAGLRAQGTVMAQQAKADSPEAQASLAQAQLRQLQLALAEASLQRGDVAGAVNIASGRGTPNQRIAEDMFGNPIGTYDAQGNIIPYTEEQLAEYRRASGLAQGRP